MRLRLRGRIMLLTVGPLLLLAFATVWIVNRSFSSQVSETIHEDLRRSGAVLENVLSARAHSLLVAGQMIVQDPKFFSVLTIPASYRDPQLRETVAGVARDFNAITEADLFEVTDARGQVIAAVGRDRTQKEGRAEVVRAALEGREVSIILEQPRTHYQVTAMPVLAGGRMVGTLLLGARIGDDLAASMQRLTRSEVTFLSRGEPTGGTVMNSDRGPITRAVVDLERRHPGGGLAGTVLEIKESGHLYLTLVGLIPGSRPHQRQFFVLQRALDAETAFLRATQFELLAIGVAAALLALIIGAFIADRITAPVRRLVRGAEEMERGNYDYPLPRPTEDEIGDLSSRFEDMRRQQRDYVHNLRKASRAKSDFISVASHELRTPISVIQGFLEMMFDGVLGPVTTRQRSALEATDKSIAALTKIADDAMNFAQIEGETLDIERSAHDAAGLVAEAVAKASALGAGRKVAVTHTVHGELPQVEVDGPRLVQAITNLVANGIRFTPDGGRVEVATRRDGDHLVVAVRDTGIGIDAPDLTNVFDRAFIVRDSLNHHSSATLEFGSAGLGLGLPIARGIAEAHGGRLTVDSTKGQGSTFTLSVPLGAPSEMEHAA